MQQKGKQDLTEVLSKHDAGKTRLLGTCAAPLRREWVRYEVVTVDNDDCAPVIGFVVACSGTYPVDEHGLACHPFAWCDALVHPSGVVEVTWSGNIYQTLAEYEQAQDRELKTRRDDEERYANALKQVTAT